MLKKSTIAKVLFSTYHPCVHEHKVFEKLCVCKQQACFVHKPFFWISFFKTSSILNSPHHDYDRLVLWCCKLWEKAWNERVSPFLFERMSHGKCLKRKTGKFTVIKNGFFKIDFCFDQKSLRVSTAALLNCCHVGGSCWGIATNSALRAQPTSRRMPQ